MHSCQRYDRQDVLKKVHEDPCYLRRVPRRVYDEEIVFEAVRQAAPLLQRAKEFVSNRPFVLRCIRVSARSLKFVCPKLLQDRDFICAAVQTNGLSLEYAKDYRSDHRIVWLAVSSSGLALEYASSEPVSYTHLRAHETEADL
eukprot:1823615-Amphidinium_carterae.1